MGATGPAGTYTAGTGISIGSNIITNTGVVTASNGLTLTSGDVKLGGTLIQNTTVTHAAFDMIHDLTGVGDFEVRKSGATDLFVSGINGNVGIGTAAPNAIFHVKTASGNTFINIDNSSAAAQSGLNLSVNGTAKANIYYDPTAATFGANGAVLINDFGGSAGSTLINRSGGNVGIGAVAIPNAKLDVLGTVRVNDNAIYLRGTTDVNHGLVYANINASDGPRLFGFAGGLLGTSNGTNALYWNNAGNVSIGTGATPAYNLEIGGSFGFGNGTAGSYRSRTETRNDAGQQATQSGDFETSAPVNFPAGASSWWHLMDTRHSNNTNNYAMQISGSFFDQEFFVRKTNNAANTAWSRMITSSNIGTNAIQNQNAAAQTANFWVNGTGTANKLVATANNDWYLQGGDDHQLRDVNISNVMGLWGLQNSTHGGIQLGNNGAAIIYGNAGNIGINTTAPGAQLEIGGLPASAFRTAYLNISSNNSSLADRPYFRGTNTHFVLAPRTTGASDIYLAFPGDLTAGSTVNTRIQETVYITATGSAGNGNVGIGTTAPTQKLDIVGNLKFSGTLMPNNNAGTTGQVLTSTGAATAPTWNSGFLRANYTIDYQTAANTFSTALNQQIALTGLTRTISLTAGDRVIIHAKAGIFCVAGGYGNMQLIARVNGANLSNGTATCMSVDDAAAYASYNSGTVIAVYDVPSTASYTFTIVGSNFLQQAGTITLGGGTNSVLQGVMEIQVLKP